MAAPDSVRALGRLALAVVPVWLVWSLATSPSPDPVVRIAIVAVAVLAFVSPVEGLLTVTLLAPLGDLIGISMTTPIRFSEAVVVGFFAGWLARPALHRRTGPVPPAAIRYVVWGLAAIVVASIAAEALYLRETAPPVWASASSVLQRTYFEIVGEPVGAISGARVVEGLGLSAAVVMALRTKPMVAVWIPEALGTGCAAATAASIMLWRGIAFPAVLARHALIGDRIVAHVTDLNAAGSYFALVLCLAAGMGARERGWRRIGWSVVTASALMGLWLSASRSATAAAVLAVATSAVWLMTRRWSPSGRSALIALVVIAIGVGLFVREKRIERDPTYRGGGFRTEFATTSVRMIRTRPWFGIGVGQYYSASPLFLTPQLAYAYGAENAHNYFLQIAAELGLIGFAACAILLAATAWLVARTLARAPDDYRLLGLAAGVAAFLLTCLTGHPLLVGEVSYPFWIAVGLMLALASPIRTDGSADHRFVGLIPARAAFATALMLLAVSIPLRAREAPPRAPRTRGVEGLSEWEDGADGRRYRWTDDYASVFIEGNPSIVEIPMRAPQEDHGETPVRVEVSVEGSRGQPWLIGKGWTPIRIELPPSKSPLLNVRRINIKTDRLRRLVDPQGHARLVGVQVGESTAP